MKTRLHLAALAFVLLSCQFLTPRSNEIPPRPSEAVLPPAATPTAAVPLPADPTALPVDPPTPTTDVSEPDPDTPISPAGELQPDLSNSFSGEFTKMSTWQPAAYTGPDGSLPVDLNAAANPRVADGLTQAQRGALTNNGFVVIPTHESQFADIRFSVAKVQGQPYFLTTDAAYHALHVTFDELLKSVERDALRSRITSLTQTMLGIVRSYPARGSGLEDDTRLAAAYLAVGLRLFDPQVSLPPELDALIQPQIQQIMAGGGRAPSALIPNFEDDYGAYKPVGHYAGDPVLECYFRGMTWFGRVAFTLRDPQRPDFVPSRAPLIVTMALRQTTQSSAAGSWGSLTEILDYLIGPTDDPGPAELAGLMDAVYGPQATFQDLTDEAKWQRLLEQADQLPAPQINSTFVNSTAALQSGRDWRLLGQRFTLDGAILQNMIYDRVGTPENKRKIPSGLDVMAALGSPAALKAQEAAGETRYAHYTDQMKTLQAAVAAQPEDEWLNRFYSGWLYSFIPQVAARDTAQVPAFMQSPAWGYKDLNSALGSWAELKHDTVLYSKMPEFMGGGGPPASPPAPAYVEPNPAVFYRLAYITSDLRNGLDFRLSGDYGSSPENELSLERILPYLSGLSESYTNLGDLAAKELAGEPLDELDFETITDCLGITECMADAFPEPPPVPLVAAVSGAEDQVLEVGVGPLDRIFVVAMINGQAQIAQGGVFSYYEFTQPRDNRLTDEQWREKLVSAPPDRPTWTGQFLLPGGAIREVLAFRKGDVYIITEAGGKPPLNVRATPSRTGQVLQTLETGAYIQIVDGPVQADGANWWKVSNPIGQDDLGYVMENPAWYERAYGQ